MKKKRKGDSESKTVTIESDHHAWDGQEVTEIFESGVGRRRRAPWLSQFVREVEMIHIGSRSGMRKPKVSTSSRNDHGQPASFAG